VGKVCCLGNVSDCDASDCDAGIEWAVRARVVATLKTEKDGEFVNQLKNCIEDKRQCL